MKKTILFTCLSLLALGVAACGNNSDSTSETKTTDTLRQLLK